MTPDLPTWLEHPLIALGVLVGWAVVFWAFRYFRQR